MAEEREKLRAKKDRLDRLRPLTGRGLQALAEWYDVELTWSSNAIEGNTLTRSETAIVLEKGITIGGKPLKDHLEAVGHRDALGYVRTLAARSEPIRETDIREIHRLILTRIDPDEAGAYSRHQRMIAGSAVVLPSPAEIPALMGDFVRWLQGAPPDPETAFAAHARLVAIHPFSDGNGRTARLLMNLLLLRAGYPPVVIGPEHRARYIEALETLQLRNDPAGYEAFMAARLEASLDDHIALLTRGSAERDGMAEPR
ncbi:MAG: Fic family protein [Stellaceae bacterium]